MSLVVSDASPINILIRIKQIDILSALFGRVIIPSTVATEMSHPRTPQIVQRWIASPPEWLEVMPPGNEDQQLDRHRGERDAIQLALALSAPLLLDDLEPRKEAIALGLLVIGTVGVLERAAWAGLIVDLARVHDALRATDFRIDDRLLASSLARVAELRR